MLIRHDFIVGDLAQSVNCFPVCWLVCELMISQRNSIVVSSPLREASLVAFLIMFEHLQFNEALRIVKRHPPADPMSLHDKDWIFNLAPRGPVCITVTG